MSRRTFALRSGPTDSPSDTSCLARSSRLASVMLKQSLLSHSSFSSQFASALLVVFALSGASAGLRAAETSGQSALETDPQGWTDILSAPDLKGWYRVPVPPTGKLGREQWHVDAAKKLLICDGDGGHDMLLADKEYADAIFHFEFRYTKVEGKTGYNSGAYVRNSRRVDLASAQFGDAKDGHLFGQTSTAGGKEILQPAKQVTDERQTGWRMEHHGTDRAG